MWRTASLSAAIRLEGSALRQLLDLDVSVPPATPN